MKIQKNLFLKNISQMMFLLFMITPGIVASSQNKIKNVSGRGNLTVHVAASPRVADHLNSPSAAASATPSGKPNAHQATPLMSPLSAANPKAAASPVVSVISQNSRAKGQSTHADNFATLDRRKSKSSKEFKIDGEQPVAESKPIPKLTQQDLDTIIASKVNRKKIALLIAGSIKYAKTTKKAIVTTTSEDETAKQYFGGSFKLLIKSNYEKQIADETLVLDQEIITRKAEDIWENKEQYRSRCCSCC